MMRKQKKVGRKEVPCQQLKGCFGVRESARADRYVDTHDKYVCEVFGETGEREKEKGQQRLVRFCGANPKHKA